MCFPPVRKSKRARGQAEAYRVHRSENSASGAHDRRHSSVQRHLATAPMPDPDYNGRRYPKKHHNTEEHYDTESPLFEYPTMEYPWKQQNAKGKGRVPSPEGRHHTYFEPSYTRTITDSQKNIRGVSYHPYQRPADFLRTEEIYPPRRRRRRHS